MAGAGPGGTTIVIVVPGPPPARLVVTQAVAPALVVTQAPRQLPPAGLDPGMVGVGIVAAFLPALGVVLLVTLGRRLRTA